MWFGIITGQKYDGISVRVGIHIKGKKNDDVRRTVISTG